MMRRGVAAGIILMILMLLGSYQLYYAAMVGMSGIRVGVRRYQEDIYALQNSLDAGREYMKTSLRYSVYQACHDSLKSSGWADVSDAPSSERHVEGDESYATLPAETVFDEGLEQNILSNINAYASGDYNFMGAYNVKLPRYETADVERTGENTLSINVDSSKKLEITRFLTKLKLGETYFTLKESAKESNIEEIITIRKNAGMEETIETPCYDLYLQGVEESERLTEKMNEEIAGEMASLQAGIQKPDANACNLVSGEAAGRIEDSLEADGVEVIDVTLTFAQIEYDNANGLCSLKSGTATAKAKVTTEGPADQTFPVWNGQELAFEPLRLVFIVKAQYATS